MLRAGTLRNGNEQQGKIVEKHNNFRSMVPGLLKTLKDSNTMNASEIMMMMMMMKSAPWFHNFDFFDLWGSMIPTIILDSVSSHCRYGFSKVEIIATVCRKIFSNIFFRRIHCKLLEKNYFTFFGCVAMIKFIVSICNI